MRTPMNVISLAIAAACAAGLIAASPVAVACSLVEFRDNGRYVGGDLVSQIANKADTIQIVQVTDRYLVNRAYSLGRWYLGSGDTDLPANYPEYIDQFAFAFDVVETLKMDGDPDYFIYDKELRIVGYEMAVLEPDPEVLGSPHPNRLPSWLMDRPGDDGYAFIGANPDAGLGGGECSMPYFLEVGQQFVALRDSLGRLYPASGAFPLVLETEFLTGSRRRERLPLNMQSLVPISGPADPFVSRLRQSVAARTPGR